MEEVSIGKSVPNLITYLHEFFQNFSQSPAIQFELISFRVNFNSEIADSGPHLSATARRADSAA
jgi:sulfur relay (sulfurtransferase) DsrC/TusE family protein